MDKVHSGPKTAEEEYNAKNFWQLDHLDSSLNYSRAILKNSCSNPFSAGQDVIRPISILWRERDGSYGQGLVVTKQKATTGS